MATGDGKSSLDQQKDAITVLRKSGQDDYILFLKKSDILDFLSVEEKQYFADLHLEEIIYSNEDDEEVEEEDLVDGVCLSLEIDGPSPLVNTVTLTEMAFSPGIAKKIIDIIRKSTCSIKIAMFMFTYVEIFQALCERMRAKKTYVDIQILVDESQFEEFMEMAKKIIKNKFRGQEIGIKVKSLGGNQNWKRSGKAHEKFMIVDGSIAVNGSYNFTWTSENVNHENVIISRDKDAIVSPLIKHFKRLSGKAKFKIL